MKSKRGVATGGESIDPRELAEEPAETNSKTREAPAPGVPVSEKKYKRMKEAAKHAPARRVKEAQEDPQKKKSK